MAFTIGWTPCTGPILAAILFYASGTNTVMQGAFLLLIYAMGFSIPFFIFSCTSQKVYFKKCENFTFGCLKFRNLPDCY